MLPGILDKVKDSIVTICLEDRPVGTGLVISQYGFVVTCAHVVGGALAVEVRKGPRVLHAEVYRRNTQDDIAILKMRDRPFPFSQLRPNEAIINEGDRVFVIGFPDLPGVRSQGPSITDGVVSACYRDSNGELQVIQISAPINPGCSGAPVIHAGSGIVIGIAVSRLRSHQDHPTKLIEGVGFCVPASKVLSVISEFELEPLTVSWDYYVDSLLARYEYGAVFQSYINLKCRSHRDHLGDLVEYVTQWLSQRSSPLLCILGEFGSGKSLLCHKLAYILAQGYKESPAASRLPFIVNLRQYSEYGSLRHLILDSIGRQAGLPIATYDQFEIVQRSGKLLMMYDGFDEMTMRVNRMRMVENFREINRTIVENCKVILTCRTHYFTSGVEERKILARSMEAPMFESLLGEQTQRKGMDLIYIEDFSDKDIEEYLRLNLGNEWDAISNKIRSPSFYDLADLAKRPIFLDVIVKTVPEMQFMGQNIGGTKLYDSYTNLCLDREARTRGLPATESTRLVENLAFHMYVSNTPYVEIRSIQGLANAPLLAYADASKIEEFLRRSALFRRDETSLGERLAFIHQSFLEFFVAKMIFREIQRRDHTIYATEYLTTQIDKYLFDLLDMKDQTGIIVAWLERHPDVNVRMNCASTLGRTGDAKFVHTLRTCLEVEEDIGVAGRISEALANLGERHVVEDFLLRLDRYAPLKQDTRKPDGHRLLFDIVDALEVADNKVVESLIAFLKHPNARIRKYSAFMLGRIGDQTAVPAVMDCLIDKRGDIRTRRYAAAALGLIGGPTAVEMLQAVASTETNQHLRLECQRAIQMIQDRSAVTAS